MRKVAGSVTVAASANVEAVARRPIGLVTPREGRSSIDLTEAPLHGRRRHLWRRRLAILAIVSWGFSSTNVPTIAVSHAFVYDCRVQSRHTCQLSLQSSIDSAHMFWDQSTARNDAVMEQIEQLEEAPVTKPEETRRVYEPPAIIYESLISARAGTNPIGRFEGPVPPFEDPATD